MKKCWLIIAFLILLIPTGVSAEDYLLRSGDVLNINVFGYPELTFPEMTVRPDGKISYPFVGEISVEGMTVTDTTKLLSERLSKYYVDPNITVNVTKYGATRVCVVGEVNRPGLYDLEKGHTLLDAIGASGGWTKEAAKKKVFILHKDMKGEPIRVNLLELLKKGDTKQNLVLAEGDIVYLSENGKINISQDLSPLVNTAYYIRNWSRKL